MADSISNDLSQINKFDTQKKGFLFLFLLLLFLASIVVSSNLRRGKTPAQNGATPGVSPQVRQSTSLAIAPVAETFKVGQTRTVSVDLLYFPVTAVDVVITYDPAVFSVSNVQNGGVFDRVIVKKIEPGTITFSAAVTPERATSVDKGTILTFSAKALKEASSSAIEFDTQKTITALNGQNTLGLSTGGKYKVMK